MTIKTIFFSGDGQWRIVWRLLTMVVLMGAAVLLINKGWRAAGLPGQRTASPFQFLAIVVLIVGSTLAIIKLLLRFFEKRGLDAIWLPADSTAWKNTVVGTVLGAIPISLLVGLAVVFGYGEIVSNGISATDILNKLVPTIAAIFLLAGWEELVMRGYLLRQLALGTNSLVAVLVTGILFGLAHSGNPGANWEGLLYTMIGGILMGLLLLRTASLWLVIGYHFGWNAISGNLFGLSVSGTDIKASVFSATLSGPDWLTGGSYGFESSLPAVLCEFAVLSVTLMYLYKKRPEPGFEL